MRIFRIKPEGISLNPQNDASRRGSSLSTRCCRICLLALDGTWPTRYWFGDPLHSRVPLQPEGPSVGSLEGGPGRTIAIGVGGTGMRGITRGFHWTDRERSQPRSRGWTLKSWPCHCSGSPENYLVRVSFFFLRISNSSFCLYFLKLKHSCSTILYKLQVYIIVSCNF